MTDAVPVAREICAGYANRADALLEILHDLQDRIGWIPADAVPAIAEALNLTRAEVHGVVSYYDDFKDAPHHGPVVKLCRAEACQAVGCEAVAAALPAALHAETVYCLGNCALGPAAMVAGRLIGRATPALILAAVEEARRG